MKNLKMFGLVVVTAMGLLAFTGVATAQAALFTDSAKTVKYANGTVVDLSLKSGSAAKFTNGGETLITCSESTAKGKTSSESGETVPVSLETLSWGGCNTTTDTLAAGKLEISWTSGTNGEVVGQESKWTVNISGASCTYGLGEGVKLGTLVGGETPTLKVEALVARTAGGFLCPGALTWDAEYVVTEPHALYIGAPLLTSLYTDSAKTVKYAAGTVVDLSLKSKTSIKTLSTGGSLEATCTESTAKGKTASETSEAISLSLETLSWGGCNQTTDTVTNGRLEIKWTSGSNAEVIGKESQWTEVISGVGCIYGFGTGTNLGTLTGGETPVLKIAAVVSKTGGSFLCPATTVWEAEYVVTEPHALYVGTVPVMALYTNSAKTIKYPAETVVDLTPESGSTVSFTSGSETVATCTGSTVKGKTSSVLGETISLNIETLSWSGCSQTTDTVSNGKLDVQSPSGSNGEVIGKESQWTLGISGVSCSYGFGEGVKLGTLVGGETPTLKIETLVPRTAGGFLCPSAVTWHAEYVVTEPHALYVGN
jgi:hypothetical protein